MPDRDDFASWYRARMLPDSLDLEAAKRARKLVGLRTLAFYYKGQLRAHLFHELFALVGVAAGVALLFAVQIANKSITGSFDQLIKGIDGRASLEVVARSPEGFNQNLYKKIKQLKNVEAAAPVLEHRIGVKGPRGRRLLTLVGADERLGALGGSLVTQAAQRGRNLTRLGLQLTEPTAAAIGARIGQPVRVEIGERTKRMPLAGVLTSDTVGPLAQSPVALAHLGFAQDILDMRDRITRVLVAPQPGQRASAKAEIARLAGGGLDVRPSDTEGRLLNQAATSDRQTTELFSAISLVVGILLVYNAMLLSIGDRRRFIASLRSWGIPNQTIIASLTFDALILGTLGSLLGLVIGAELAKHVLNQVPAFLFYAFPVGAQRVIDSSTVIISLGAGIVAALVAAIRPAIEILRTAPREQFLKYDFSLKDPRAAANRRLMFLIGCALAGLALLLARLVPALALVSVAGLALVVVLVLPGVVGSLIVAGQRAARRTYSAALRIALGELAVNPMRATALAATGALALFAISTVTGFGADVSRGQRQLTADTFGPSDLWISMGKGNAYRTEPFKPTRVIRRIKRLPDVKALYTHTFTFVDLPDRRLWLIGNDPRYQPIAPSQLVNGGLTLADRRLRDRGWAALTSTMASKMGLHLGDRFALPTPSGPRRFRLAATISNYGWFPGAVIINRRDYIRFWHSNQATLLGVKLRRGVPAWRGRLAVKRALGKNSALTVQTTDDQQVEYTRFTRQGLLRMHQISTMAIIAVVLAVAAAILGAVWQRRRRLWSLVSMGITRQELYRTVFWEAALILILGCLLGAAFGLVGQALADRWLEATTGTQAPFTPAWTLMLKTLGVVIGLAAVSIILPLRLAMPLRARAMPQFDD